MSEPMQDFMRIFPAILGAMSPKTPPDVEEKRLWDEIVREWCRPPSMRFRPPPGVEVVVEGPHEPADADVVKRAIETADRVIAARRATFPPPPLTDEELKAQDQLLAAMHASSPPVEE